MLPEEQDLTDGTFPSPQMPKSDIKQLYTSSNVTIQKMGKPSLNDNSVDHGVESKAKQIVNPPTPPSDIISSTLGDFGIWQLRTVLIIFLCKIPAAWFMACIIYTAPDILARREYRCDPSTLKANQSVTHDQCRVHEIVDNNVTTTRCAGFIYNSEFHGLNQDFNLICGREIYVAWTQYWHLFGVLVGGIIGTKITRWMSPRNVYFWSMIFQIILGIATGYARDLTLHCVFRFLAAVCCATMFTTGQAIFIDIIGGAYRWGVVMLYDTFWSIGVILLPGVSSFFRHWTFLYLGISFPVLILMFLLYWTPDSPRWLLKNGHPGDIERVERTLRQAAAINDRKVSPDLREELEILREKLRKAPPPSSWLELWHGHDRAKIHMIAVHIALAAYIVNFMGLLLNIRSFGRENRNTSTITVGLCEIVGCFLAVHLNVKHDKWKWQWAGGLNVLGGLIACLGWTFSKNDEMDDSVKITLWLLLTAVPKVTVACGQSMLLACMNDSLPPQKRPTFAFSAVTWARIFLLSAPFINVLKKFDVALSLCFFGVVIVVGGVCTCLIRPPSSNVAPQATVPMQAEPLLEKHGSPLGAAVWVFDKESKTGGDSNSNK